MELGEREGGSIDIKGADRSVKLKLKLVLRYCKQERRRGPIADAVAKQ